MHREFLCSIVALCIASVAHAATLDSRWDIVVADDADPAVRYAAEELRSFVEVATGFSLPIGTTSARGGKHIYVGDSAAFRRSRIAFDTSDFAEEEYRVRIARRHIAIVGSSPRGTLYGVYDFCERYLGGRFLTADNRYVPQRMDLKLPRDDYQYASPFAYRWTYYTELNDHPAFMARLRQHVLTHDPKLGGGVKLHLIQHSMNQLVPVEKYGESHPEYFALVDGGRVLEAYNGPQVCSTNPNVIDIVTQGVLEQITAHPEYKNVSVSANDNLLYCRCENCVAIDASEESHMGAHLTLVNAVAERVAALHPGVRVGTLAYRYTRTPPKQLKPSENVDIWLSSFECANNRAIDDPDVPENAAFCRDLDAWLALARDVYVWHYVANLRYIDLPYPNLRALGPTLRYFRERGVRGVYAQGNGRCPGSELSDLRSYVVSQLLWNPGLDADALIDEFVALHYGEAADTMRAYIDAVEQAADAADARAGLWALPPETGLNAALAEELIALFEKGIASTADPIITARLEKASIPAYKIFIETGGELTFADNRIWMKFAEDKLPRIAAYADLCARYGVTRNEEFQPIEEYLDDVAANINGAPALRFENEAWRATLSSAMNGIMVDLLHRASGYNVLRAMGRGGINLREGVLREYGLMGYDSNVPDEFAAVAMPDGVALSKTLPDGTHVSRRLLFNKESVASEFYFDYAGTEPTTVQFGVHLDLNAGERGEKIALIAYDAAAGCVGFRNETTGRVLRVCYDPTRFESAQAIERPGLQQVDVTLRTKPAQLSSGDIYAYAYRIECIEDKR